MSGFLKYALAVAFLVVGTVQASAAGQNVKLNLSFVNADFKTVMNEIKKQSSYDFVYNADEINDNFKVTVNLKDATLEQALNACLAKQNIDYVIKDRIIVLQRKKAALNTAVQQTPAVQKSPQVNLKGRVVDVKGTPVAGVAVVLKDVGLGTSTDANGNFQLSVPRFPKIELLFTCIGMTPQEFVVTDENRDIRVVMKESAEMVQEVIVTGMEVIKRDQMTGSASVLTSKDMQMQGITSLDRILEGKIAGLNSTTVSGAPGSRAQITIRGENNLNGNTEPLWIVDGLPMMSGVPKTTTGNYTGTIMQDGVGNIMPEDIESISILKDASASAIYGAKAANGVIVITTKRGFESEPQISYTGTYENALAPSVNMGFMNSAEKLRYETSLVDNFGISYSSLAGRGGYLSQRRYDGFITEADYQRQYNELANTNTDWFKTIFRNSQSHSHNVTVRGGTKKAAYYTSINFQQKNGVLQSNQYSNAGVSFKLDYKPVKGLVLAFNLAANTRSNQDHASSIDPFKYAVFANPYEKPYNADGSYSSDHSYLASNYTTETPSGYIYDNFNILREMRQNRATQRGVDADFTFDISYEVIPGLKLQSIMRKGVSYDQNKTTISPGTYTSLNLETLAKAAYPDQTLLPSEYNNGELTQGGGYNNNWSIRNQIDYNLQLKSGHELNFLVASETTSKDYESSYFVAPSFSPDFHILGMPSFNNSVDYERMRNTLGRMFSSTGGLDRTVSFLGSFRYSYKDRYVLSFNIRTDGANTIGDAERFTPLGSLGVRWNLDNEEWFKNDIMTQFAVRGSYGYTGNMARGTYPFPTMEYSDNIYLGDRVTGAFTYPNPTIKWERKRDLNVGLEMGFLNNRVTFTADYYDNRTRDILDVLTVPASTGRETVQANGGVVRNSGFELYLNVKWIDTRDFTFSTMINGARNKNVIEKSEHGYTSYQDAIKSNVSQGGALDIIGEETGSIYGWKTAGVDPRTGRPMYYLTESAKRELARVYDNWENLSSSDKEKYSTILSPFGGIPNALPYWYTSGAGAEFSESMQYLGRSNPMFVGGFSTYFRYKNFEFMTDWTYKTGHIIPTFNDLQNAPNNIGDADLIALGYTSDMNVSSTNRQQKYLNYWRGEGDVTNVSRFMVGENDYWSSIATNDKYERGDFLRMTNLTLNYRFKTEVVNKWGMEQLMIGFNARNLLTFTKYKGLDVGTEGAFNYPVVKEFNIKLTIGF